MKFKPTVFALLLAAQPFIGNMALAADAIEDRGKLRIGIDRFGKQIAFLLIFNDFTADCVQLFHSSLLVELKLLRLRQLFW